MGLAAFWTDLQTGVEHRSGTLVSGTWTTETRVLGSQLALPRPLLHGDFHEIFVRGLGGEQIDSNHRLI